MAQRWLLFDLTGLLFEPLRGTLRSLHNLCLKLFFGNSVTLLLFCRISGGELFERIIDEDFELTEREVIKYMLQIIDGVNFIHKQGIVHLDLKPENIMCVNKTGSKIKLIDFGLARRLGNYHRGVTWAYMDSNVG